MKRLEKFRSKEYRAASVDSWIELNISHQIRSMRKQRGWTQQDLADKSTFKQETISRLESANGLPNLNTLVKLAEAFDISLVVSFEPFSKAFKRRDSFKPNFKVKPFTEEFPEVSQKESE